MSDNWNLPPGVSPSMIPGNSSRDVWLEKQMEKIEVELDKLPPWLNDAITSYGKADFSRIAEHCNSLYKIVTLDDNGVVCNAIEEARNLAQQAEEGHPPEREYDRGDDVFAG